MNIIDEADKFAENAHKGQFRKDGSPYINHPRRVKAIYESFYLNNIKMDELSAICLLHDVIEDTNITLEDIISKFGMFVGSAVNQLTRPKGTSKIDYYKLLGDIGWPHVKEIKLFDRKANLEDTLALVSTNNVSQDNIDFARYYLKDTLNLFEYAKMDLSYRERIRRHLFDLMQEISGKVY